MSYSKILLHKSTQQHIYKFQFFYLFMIYFQISEISEIFEKNKDTFDLTIGGVQNLVIELETYPQTELFRNHNPQRVSNQRHLTILSITSYFYQLHLCNWWIGSFVSWTVMVFVNRPLTIQGTYWSVQLIEKASNVSVKGWLIG